MPHLTDEAVQRFIAVYGKEYAEPITLDETREMARTVLTLYAVIMRPLPDEQKSMRRQREKQKKRRLRTSQRAS